MAKKLTPAQTLLVIHIKELLKPYEGKEYEPEVVTEHQFMPDRKFRFDVALPSLRIGIECDGGQWSGGHRHNQAIERDYEKLNLAQMLGWRCLRFTNKQVLRGEAKSFLEKWL